MAKSYVFYVHLASNILNMTLTFIGRTEEKGLLFRALNSNEPELVAVYGRRRVGKTFLINHVFGDHIIFECSGIHNASTRKQLENFSLALDPKNVSTLEKPVMDWLSAFQILIKTLEPRLGKHKKVIFFDEFPWLNTHKSGFLQAFGHFWNSWASKQQNLVVVICGSSASWMIRQVVNNRGGLHNRITLRIRLLPFTLKETELFLRSRHIALDRYQILQLYMVMGGIPQYLKEIRKGESATQIIDRVCFTKDGFLAGEFQNLYQALFSQPSNHLEVIRSLAGRSSGLTRSEIISASKMKTGGRISTIIGELSESGFITSYIPFGKHTKDTLYRLTDEFSLFYFSFIENNNAQGPGTWITFTRGSSWKVWSGYAFEGICIKHQDQIKSSLGISGVYSQVSSWRYIPGKGEEGAQVDMLIDRQDHCINICEMKFSLDRFAIVKKYNDELAHKLSVFRSKTKTKKSLLLTMITTYGVADNTYKIQSVQNEVTMDSLFQ